MVIKLPDELGRSLRPLVLSGQFASEGEVVAEAVREFLRRHPVRQAARRDDRPSEGCDESGTSIGLFSDDPELMDRIVREAMHDRRHLPSRAEDRE